MNRTKRILCPLMALLLAFAGLTAFSGCAKHVHRGELRALITEPAYAIPRCGVFYCPDCGNTYEESVTGKNAGIPVVSVEGSLEGISKTEKVAAEISYYGEVEFKSAALLKWQGGSTLQFPKKNYSVTLTDPNGNKNPVMLNKAWGSQSKYCLKANWEDYAGARNVVSAKLWGDIVRARGSDDRLNGLVNGGAVDGFPALLYINGDFEGLYSLNTPKDRWIFGMEDGADREGLLFGEEWTPSVQLQEPIANVNRPTDSGWEVEYCSTSKSAAGEAWLAEGMNGLITFLKTNEGQALREGIGDYTDVDLALDYMLFILFICGADNTGRNILWATFDGQKYLPCAYDLDNTWLGDPNAMPEELREAWATGSALRENLLFSRLLDAYPRELSARWAALRKGPLTYENAEKRFSDYLRLVPDAARDAEAQRWPRAAAASENDLARLTSFFSARADTLDAHFGGRE